jgi:serine/threonine-protein kinase HipA
VTGLPVATCFALDDEASLSPVDRAFLWRRQFLNAYAFEGYAGGLPEGL